MLAKKKHRKMRKEGRKWRVKVWSWRLKRRDGRSGQWLLQLSPVTVFTPPINAIPSPLFSYLIFPPESYVDFFYLIVIKYKMIKCHNLILRYLQNCTSIFWKYFVFSFASLATTIPFDLNIVLFYHMILSFYLNHIILFSFFLSCLFIIDKH